MAINEPPQWGWHEYPVVTATGWSCPKCGKVYAPWVYSCATCSNSSWPQPIWSQLPTYTVNNTTNTYTGEQLEQEDLTGS